MIQLAVAEACSLPVDPRLLFVPAGIVVAPGERYRIKASGKWKDWCHVTDAAGWGIWPLRLGNRVPAAAIFCLCGCIGSDERNAFAIGAELDWTVPESVAALEDRKLQFFANDWPCRYGNNHPLPPEQGGPLTVTITRLA